MSKQKRPPLLSNDEIDRICEMHPYSAQLYAKLAAVEIDILHEAARAKDAELIQRLVDAIEPTDCHHPYCRWLTNRALDCDCHMAALAAAAEAGFKPSDQ